jgi:ribosomal protein S18 acetylase RimI-like enzyme
MSYAVYLTADRAAIHAFLSRDPLAAAYAIGDLEAPYFQHCTWMLACRSGTPRSLALLYRGLDPPVLLTLGECAGIAAIFGQLALPDRVAMSAQAAHLSLFRAAYDFAGDRIRPMVRMSIAGDDFRPMPGGPAALVRRLGPADCPAIEALIREGGASAPDAFDRSQVEAGVFFGVDLAPHGLVALAGTHLVATSSWPEQPWLGVAAVGNLYTHPAVRGRGYGQATTSAVTGELLRRGLLVVLNVERDNVAAIQLYHKLGYREHSSFFEGFGRRVQPGTG